MPRPTLARELDQLAVLIHNTGSAGVSSDALLLQLGGTHERSTLQRLLARLAEQGRITVRGEGQATRYHPSNPSHPQQPAAKATPPAAWATAAPITTDYTPTSAEGAAIRAAFSLQHANNRASTPPGLLAVLNIIAQATAPKVDAGKSRMPASVLPDDQEPLNR